MLAKVWKKALLAICIIACIYNVMNKLVSRTSLEVQLKSVELNVLNSEETYEDQELEDTSKEDKVNTTNKSDDSDDNNTIVVVFDGDE